MDEKRTLGEVDDIFYKLGLAVLAVALAAALLYICTGINVLYAIKFPCIFNVVTGLYCPGCGGTRAMRALLAGHIWQSIKYHPAVLYGVVVYSEFMVRCFLRKHFKGNFGPDEDGKILPYIYVGIAIMLLQWIVKIIAQVKFGYVMSLQ